MSKIGTFAENWKTFFSRPASELVFSLKYSSLKSLTGKYHPRPGKNLFVEKKDLKMAESRFFGYGNLTTFRKSHFSSKNDESIYNKVYIAGNYNENRVL